MSSTKDTYSREAKYDEYTMDLSKVYYHKIIKEVTRECPEGSILDIGCYDGSLGEVFLKRGYKVSGLEAHKEASTKALEKGIDVVQKDIESGFPWKDNSFDCVIAAEIIEHIYDTDKFLEEIKRVLKKDGVLVISFPNVACLTNRIKLLFNMYPRFCEYQAGSAGGHIRVYTLGAIKKQLREHGFNTISSIGANFPFPMHVKGIPNILRKIAVYIGDFTPSLAGQIIISSRNP